MTTIHVDQWPHEATEVKDGRTKFAAVDVTISYVYAAETGPRYKFREDTTPDTGKDGKLYKGVFWQLRGAYIENTRDREVPIDPGYKKGDRVSVLLGVAVTQQGGVYHDIVPGGIGPPRNAPAPPESAPPAPVGTPALRDETRASIERQVAFKGQTEVVCAILATGKPVAEWLHGNNDEVKLWRSMRDELWTGEPPFNPEDSPLVRAAQEMGAEIVGAAREAPVQETEDDWGDNPPPTPEEPS